jgi:hypothetical protein
VYPEHRDVDHGLGEPRDVEHNVPGEKVGGCGPSVRIEGVDTELEGELAGDSDHSSGCSDQPMCPGLTLKAIYWLNACPSVHLCSYFAVIDVFAMWKNAVFGRDLYTQTVGLSDLVL